MWGRALGAAGGGVGASCELEMLKGDGALAAVRLEAVTLTRGRDGARLLVTVADNRARIEAARAIRESEAHYRQLFNVNPVPMLIAAREGLAVLAANPAAERACGYSVDEFRARSSPTSRSRRTASLPGSPRPRAAAPRARSRSAAATAAPPWPR